MSSRDLDTVKPARAWGRYWASIIDGFVFLIPALGIPLFLYAVMGVSPTVKTIRENAYVAIWFYAIGLFYNWYFLAQKGTTLGKDAYGLRVVSSTSGHVVTSRAAAVRESFKVVSHLIPIAGGFITLIDAFLIVFTKRKMAIYDLVAQTQVVKSKKPWKMRKQIAFFGSIVVAYACLIYLFMVIVDY